MGNASQKLPAGSKYMMTFFRLAKQVRPSSIPFTTLAKLSSRMIIAAASLLT